MNMLVTIATITSLMSQPDTPSYDLDGNTLTVSNAYYAFIAGGSQPEVITGTNLDGSGGGVFAEDFTIQWELAPGTYTLKMWPDGTGEFTVEVLDLTRTQLLYDTLTRFKESQDLYRASLDELISLSPTPEEIADTWTLILGNE